MSRDILPIPENIEIFHEGFTMYIRRKWFSPIFIFLTFFVIFWDGFLVVWYGLAISEITKFSFLRAWMCVQ